MRKFITGIILFMSFYRLSAQSSCTGIPTVSYGGKTYNTVMIGTQCWLKENLNVGNFISNTNQQSDNCIIEKYCYSNDTANCTAFGGLYQWAEIVRYYRGISNNTSWSPALTGSLQGICPGGWHIPTAAEWKTLFQVYDPTYNPVNNPTSTIAGGKLKETGTAHWSSPNTGADNQSGFSAFGGGYADGTNFSQLMSQGYYAALDDAGFNNSKYAYFVSSSANGVIDTDVKTYGLSVRCVLGNGIDYNQIESPPNSATASPSTICAGGSSTLTVVGGSLGITGDWYWYKASCGGSLSGTGASVVVTPANTQTYYVRAEGCGSSTSCVSIEVIIGTASITNAVINAGDSLCKGISTTIGVSGGSCGSGNWYWYSNSCGGTLLGSGLTFHLTPVSDTTYWVRALTSCNTTACLSSYIIVNTSSVSADSISLFSGWKSQIHLTEDGGSLGSGANWFWYTGSCGGTKVGSGNIFRLYSPTVISKYYVRAEGICNLTACKSYTIAASAIAANIDNFNIHLNFPNPVNKTSALTCDLPYPAMVNISIYNLFGGKLTELYNGFRPAGEISFPLDNMNLHAGIYLLKVVTSYGTVNRKLIYSY